MNAATVLVFRSGDVHDPNSAITQPTYGTRTHKIGLTKYNLPSSQPPETHTPIPLRKLKLVSSNDKAVPLSLQEIVTAPVFPPRGVMLHSEDATNKVLKAIGRSFLSVDNCAMTIKDLAEMCMSFGLSCQRYLMCATCWQLSLTPFFLSPFNCQRVRGRPSDHIFHPEPYATVRS
jgi:hypothetical protein